MRKSSLYQSVALHAIAVLLMAVDLSFIWRKDITIEQEPIMVDLSEVKVSEMTNLPTKAEFAEKDSPATKVKPEEPKAEEKTTPQQVQATEVSDKADDNQPKDETPVEPKQDFIVPPQPSKPKVPEKKPEPKRPTPPPQPKKPAAPQKKPEPKKPEPKKQQQNLANPLKDLMASVDNMAKQIDAQNANATIKTGTQVNNMGIEGGIGGSYFSDLSISETDAIAVCLRSKWNLDPGAMGIEDMLIEIRAQLTQDGNVVQGSVVALDRSRYNSDTHFRAVANSAIRAVYACQPYSVLAQKYPQKYDKWKTMLLRFNPINHSVN